MPNHSSPHKLTPFWIFVVGETAILIIAVATNSTSAFVFFWIGLGVICNAAEPEKLKWAALGYWWSGSIFWVVYWSLSSRTSGSSLAELKLALLEPLNFIAILFLILASTVFLKTTVWLLSDREHNSKPGLGEKTKS